MPNPWSNGPSAAVEKSGMEIDCSCKLCVSDYFNIGGGLNVVEAIGKRSVVVH